MHTFFYCSEYLRGLVTVSSKATLYFFIIKIHFSIHFTKSLFIMCLFLKLSPWRDTNIEVNCLTVDEYFFNNKLILIIFFLEKQHKNIVGKTYEGCMMAIFGELNYSCTPLSKTVRKFKQGFSGEYIVVYTTYLLHVLKETLHTLQSYNVFALVYTLGLQLISAVIFMITSLSMDAQKNAKYNS